MSAIITIDNPPINLADNALFSAFENVLDEVDASDVRALLVQAAGDHFGCGVNVKTTFVDVDSKGARQMLGQGIPICTRLEGLNIPVVCAVQGLCLAAALEIALADKWGRAKVFHVHSGSVADGDCRKLTRPLLAPRINQCGFGFGGKNTTRFCKPSRGGASDMDVRLEGHRALLPELYIIA